MIFNSRKRPFAAQIKLAVVVATAQDSRAETIDLVGSSGDQGCTVVFFDDPVDI
jgi:hypothetical protein